MFARRAEIEMLLTCLCVGAVLSALHYVFAQDQADTVGNKKTSSKALDLLKLFFISFSNANQRPASFIASHFATHHICNLTKKHCCLASD